MIRSAVALELHLSDTFCQNIHWFSADAVKEMHQNLKGKGPHLAPRRPANLRARLRDCGLLEASSIQTLVMWAKSVAQT
jgi:hypothetical protein